MQSIMAGNALGRKCRQLPRARPQSESREREAGARQTSLSPSSILPGHTAHWTFQGGFPSSRSSLEMTVPRGMCPRCLETHPKR